jgi:hypothetical protein
VYLENNTTEGEVRVATEFYGEDPDFLLTLNKLKKLFKAVTGQPADEVRAIKSYLVIKTNP